jgi:hypothetical protein
MFCRYPTNLGRRQPWKIQIVSPQKGVAPKGVPSPKIDDFLGEGSKS